ncbi:MAG: hypothetical protein EXX96DRAFT_106785 [Benjaminiella poitrasii]|nr:MAG: hypothetical protein EXX96DRAFT_106785 [Benjaminiella poitrasii]
MPNNTNNDGFDDPTDFSMTQFQLLDEHLRCPICKELYNTTIMLSTCSHSFCALCIRRSLSTEQICPKFRHWRESRKYFLNMDKGQQCSQSEQTRSDLESIVIVDDDDSEDFIPSDLPRTPSFSSNHSTVKNKRRSTRIQQNSQSHNDDQHLSIPSQQLQPSSVKDEKLKLSSMVQCPVCLQHMKYSVLDLHIEKCLQGDSRIPSEPVQRANSSSSSNNSLMMQMSNSHKSRQKQVDLGKKPVKQVYTMMNDKELRECLRSLNLPDHGDRQTKIWRHKEYVNLYNANVDSENRVSAKVLIDRLQAIERLRSSNSQLKRKLTDPDEHRSKYADHFSQLILDVKKRKSTIVEGDDNTDNDTTTTITTTATPTTEQCFPSK